MRIAKGIYNNNDLNLSLDVINEVGHNGSYLSHSDTLSIFQIGGHLRLLIGILMLIG